TVEKLAKVVDWNKYYTLEFQLRNPSEIAAPKLIKQLTDIYFTKVPKTAESTFVLSPRQIALWESQRGDHTSHWLRAVLISDLRQTINGKTYHMLLYSWDRGLDVYVDLTRSLRLTQIGMTGFVSGRAVIDSAQHKRELEEDALKEWRPKYVPGGSLQLVRETLAESSPPILDVDEEDLDLSERNLKQCKRKICDGHYTTIVRVLSSYGVSPYNDVILQELKAKHPFTSAPSFPNIPIDHHHLIASQAVVLDRIKNCLSGAVVAILDKLVSSITQVVNLFLDGKCPMMLDEYIASAPLTPLAGGGIRPIAMGKDGPGCGLHLNVDKTEILWPKEDPRSRFEGVFLPNISRPLHVVKLLDGPVSVDFDFSSELVIKRVSKTIGLMDTAAKLNDPQCELLLLRACTRISKLYFAMRTCPPRVFELAQCSFDVVLRSALERISAAMQTKLIRHVGIVASGSTFDDALCVFNTSMKIDLLSNPSEIVSPKPMKKMADIYFTQVTKDAESTFSLSSRQIALWKSQRNDHTTNWLRAVPIFGLGQTMDAFSRVFAGDIYGDHAVSCAGIIAGKEVDIWLDGGCDKPLRPVDMLLYSWDEGLDVCVDLIGLSLLTQTEMADFMPGRAVINVAQRKRVKYMAKCTAIEYGFLPFSFSSLGELEEGARLATLPFAFGGLGVYSAGDVLNYAFLASRLHSAGLQTKILRHTGIAASEPIFDDALSVFNTSIETHILSNPKSIFSLCPRQMVLWNYQREYDTFDWLRAVPISWLGQTMNACSRVFNEDIYGDHAISCAGIVGIKHRHNIMCNTLVDICYHSGILADGGLDVCVDMTGSSPLRQTRMADFMPGHVVIDAAQHKQADVVTLLKRIQKFSMAQDIKAHAAVHIFNRISFAIAKGVRAQIVSRLPSNLL
ncbi:hypothetical protein Tco_0896270, partial [Tanacetum coccineum]